MDPARGRAGRHAAHYNLNHDNIQPCTCRAGSSAARPGGAPRTSPRCPRGTSGPPPCACPPAWRARGAGGGRRAWPPPCARKPRRLRTRRACCAWQSNFQTGFFYPKIPVWAGVPNTTCDVHHDNGAFTLRCHPEDHQKHPKKKDAAGAVAGGGNTTGQRSLTRARLAAHCGTEAVPLELIKVCIVYDVYLIMYGVTSFAGLRARQRARASRAWSMEVEQLYAPPEMSGNTTRRTPGVAAAASMTVL